MLTEYIKVALGHARYRQLEDETWFAEVPDFQGVWANASSVEDCRAELAEVLEEWLLLKIRDREPVPCIGGHGLTFAEEASA
jgi:predicted RNase H-like HicB family nuclease